MNIIKSRPLVYWVCLAAFIGQSGCALTPAPTVNNEVPVPLGRVGIVAARYRPVTALDLPAKGWLGGAGRKSLQWMGKGALGSLEAGADCSGDETGLCGLFIIALSVTAGTVGGVAGGVAGALQAEPSTKVALEEEAIKTAIAGLKMPESLCERVLQVAQCETCAGIVPVADQGPATQAEMTSYSSLAKAGINTVLEIAITRFALAGEWDINPPLQFQLDSHIRLVRTADDKRFYDATITYRGSSMIFSRWADNNAQAFFQELDKAYQSLADTIDTDVFHRGSLPESDEESPDDDSEAE